MRGVLLSLLALAAPASLLAVAAATATPPSPPPTLPPPPLLTFFGPLRLGADRDADDRTLSALGTWLRLGVDKEETKARRLKAGVSGDASAEVKKEAGAAAEVKRGAGLEPGAAATEAKKGRALAEATVHTAARAAGAQPHHRGGAATGDGPGTAFTAPKGEAVEKTKKTE